MRGPGRRRLATCVYAEYTTTGGHGRHVYCLAARRRGGLIVKLSDTRRPRARQFDYRVLNRRRRRHHFRRLPLPTTTESSLLQRRHATTISPPHTRPHRASTSSRASSSFFPFHSIVCITIITILVSYICCSYDLCIIYYYIILLHQVRNDKSLRPISPAIYSVKYIFYCIIQRSTKIPRSEFDNPSTASREFLRSFGIWEKRFEITFHNRIVIDFWTLVIINYY